MYLTDVNALGGDGERHSGEKNDELGAEEDCLRVVENRAGAKGTLRTSNLSDFLPFFFRGSTPMVANTPRLSRWRLSTPFVKSGA
jgi:hypothetical protein